MLKDPSCLNAFLDRLPAHLAERTWLRCPGRPNPNRKRVLYWTHHALRTDENPALDVAIRLANYLDLPLLVYQGLSQNYRFASDRHHTFILEAAKELQESYSRLGISFALQLERPRANSPRLARLAFSSAVVVTEDFPLEATYQWTEKLADSNATAVMLVDTSCVVPMRLVGKAYDRAFAFRDATAKFYRDRIEFRWPQLETGPRTEAELPFESLTLSESPIAKLIAECDIDHSIGPVSDTRGGSVAGYARWQAFRQGALRNYSKHRNTIEIDGVSRMSAYLHYGMVSPFRLAREAFADKAEKFLDELLIWRELAYSFCYYRRDLESDASLPDWAVSTLTKHRGDPRPVVSWETLARGKTGEPLWDAAQRSLLKHGELHNNLRMTWGKAILGWSTDHRQALARLIDLNHRYALDGRDPASYGGILWCLGQFDRPFLPEQPIMGSVRPRPISVHEQRTDMVAYLKHVDRSVANPAPRIAMIGAGLGGLICSRVLIDHGFDVQCFEKSRRAGGRSSTRNAEGDHPFDHGAQYFTIRDRNLRNFLDSWIADKHVAEWRARFVAIDEPGIFHELGSLQRYVGTPSMESLAGHLSRDLSIRFETEVEKAIRSVGGYQLLAKDGCELGTFQIVLWNAPPQQTARQVPSECRWQSRLSDVEMVPCWAVMLALEQRWEVPFDGAFVNQGCLSWIARDSSKPGRSSSVDRWVFHSTIEWAKEEIDTSKEQIISRLIEGAERVTDCLIPERLFAKAHRWLYSRPVSSLPESFLWDDGNWLGACGDWCGGPRVEGALKSGIALAGRILSALHEHSTSTLRQSKPKQLSLFNEMAE